MQFDSLTFVVFFAGVLAIYNLLPGWGLRKAFLLAASYLFYAAWNPPFLLLLVASTTLDWWITRRIDAARHPLARRAWVAATLLVNLAVLGYFKYAEFLLANTQALLEHVGIHYAAPKLDVLLPIGISFYTFHSLSYCIDVYRRKFPPTPRWLDYALYVGFFPQLVAGPIVRWTQMRDQIEAPRRSSIDGVGLGLALLAFGLFEKITLADGVFAPVADAVFDAAGKASAADAWCGALAFSGQIFCDFAGYSTCALGAALALGFELPINFRQPYGALGFSDFWRRWHVSLSSWLRDYLYISLGGNRRGELRTYVNLFLTMLIGGLWHGAAWTFVAWGALHGAFLAVERVLREHVFRGVNVNAALCALGYAATLLGVVWAWVWFRAHGFADAWTLTRDLVDLPAIFSSLGATTYVQRLAVVVFALLVATHVVFRDVDLRDAFGRVPVPMRGAAIGALVTLVVLSPGETHAFIYFQF